MTPGSRPGLAFAVRETEKGRRGSLMTPGSRPGLAFAVRATEKGRRAKVYSVSKAGQRYLADERESWERFAGALAAILNVT